MQKNLILAVVLSSLVYIGWYSYMDKKIAPRREQVMAEQHRAEAEKAKAEGRPLTASSQSSAVPSEAPDKDWLKSSASVKAGKAEYLFYTDAASIKGAVYQGPVAPVELVPDSGMGFFASSLPYKFKLKTKTADSAEFTAAGPDGVVITKKFTFSADNSLNKLSITAANTGRKPVILPAWDLTVGPGLNTVKSEQKENPKLWRAIYAFQETGKKHPTVKNLKDGNAENDCVWAGVDNRYFLAALAGGSMEKTRPYRKEEMVGETKAPMLVVPFAAQELKPGADFNFETSFYLGPKDYAFLQKVGNGLDRSVDFGLFE